MCYSSIIKFNNHYTHTYQQDCSLEYDISCPWIQWKKIEHLICQCQLQPFPLGYEQTTSTQGCHVYLRSWYLLVLPTHLKWGKSYFSVELTHRKFKEIINCFLHYKSRICGMLWDHFSCILVKELHLKTSNFRFHFKATKNFMW